MSESRFLSYVLTESILYLILGLSMLILPKITNLSFGFMICFVFILYAGFKLISTVISRNFSKHTVLDVITSLTLLIAGLLLMTAPMFDIMLIIGLVGSFFVLKSISTTAFAIQVRNTLIPWKMPLALSLTELLFGLVIVITLPSGALWFAGVIAGMDFILSGVILLNMYIATKYIKGR